MKNLQKSSFIFAALAIIILSLHSVSAITGSIGNARMVLYPEVGGLFSTTIEKSILVRNVNDEAISIKLELDEDSKDFIELVDTEFTLQPDEEKKALFVVKVRKEGTYEGRINVFFSPLNEDGPGVVLSSTVIVIAKKDSDYEDAGDEDDENVDDEDSNDEGNSITGKATDVDAGSMSSGLIFMTISMAFLLIVLIVLMSIMKNKKRDVKKGGKLNAKKKS